MAKIVVWWGWWGITCAGVLCGRCQHFLLFAKRSFTGDSLSIPCATTTAVFVLRHSEREREREREREGYEVDEPMRPRMVRMVSEWVRPHSQKDVLSSRAIDAVIIRYLVQKEKKFAYLEQIIKNRVIKLCILKVFIDSSFWPWKL